MSNQQKDILIVAKGFPPNLGGVATYSEEIAFAYARMGFAPTVLTQFKQGAIGTAERRRDNVAIDVVNVGPGSQPAVFYKMLQTLKRLQRERTFAFAHATTWRVGFPPLLRKVPYFLTIHGREIAQTRKPVMRKLMNWSLGRSKAVLSISDCSRTTCTAHAPILANKTAVAWNGITWPELEVQRTEEQQGSRLLILAACALTKRKNISAAVFAIAKAKEQGLDVMLRVAGDGPERKALVAYASELGVTDNVEFLGIVPREKMPDLYRESDIFPPPPCPFP